MRVRRCGFLSYAGRTLQRTMSLGSRTSRDEDRVGRGQDRKERAEIEYVRGALQFERMSDRLNIYGCMLEQILIRIIHG